MLRIIFSCPCHKTMCTAGMYVSLSPRVVRHNGALLLAASECVVWPLESRGGRGERGGGAHGPHPL